MKLPVFMPPTSYDAEQKLWSGAPQPRAYYAEDISVGEIIHEEMRRHPKNIAQISYTENTVLNNGDLLMNATRVAIFLRDIGIGPNDIVGIIARNTTHLAAVAYACCFNTTAFHALSLDYDSEMIRQLYTTTQPKIIFCDGGADYLKIKNATKGLHNDVLIYTMSQHMHGVPTILDILESTPFDIFFKPKQLENDGNKVLAILCTSGTTGFPKAVIINNGRKVYDVGSYLSAADVQYSHSTLDWMTGVRTLIVNAVYGATRIIAHEPFEPVRFLKAVERYKITSILQAPNQLAAVVECSELKPDTLKSVRFYICSGGKVSQVCLQKLAKFAKHARIIQAYGMTELNGSISTNIHFNEKPNSVGRVNVGNKVKILDDNGVPLGPNEIGEILCYNNLKWLGYYNNEAETRIVFDSEGWYHTGDLGYFDDENFLYIVGRKKHMLKCLNFMYYPYEIEKVIADMPEVAEVCVFGVWSLMNGDEAAAAVVPRSDVTTLRAQDVVDYVAAHMHLKQKHLRAGAIIVNELKRNINGKIDREAIKAEFLSTRGKRKNGHA